LQGKILNTELLGLFDIIDNNKSMLTTVVSDNTKHEFLDKITNRHVLFVLEIDKSDTIKEGTKQHVLVMRNIVNVFTNLKNGLATHKKFATVKSIIQAIDNIGKNDELYNKQLIDNLHIISDAFDPKHHLQIDDQKHWRATKNGHILNICPITNIKKRTFDKYETLIRIVAERTLTKNKDRYELLLK
jgi:hypothetical protein